MVVAIDDTTGRIGRLVSLFSATAYTSKLGTNLVLTNNRNIAEHLINVKKEGHFQSC